MIQAEIGRADDTNAVASDGRVPLQRMAGGRKTAGVFVRILANQREKKGSARNETVETRRIKSQRDFFASFGLLFRRDICDDITAGSTDAWCLPPGQSVATDHHSGQKIFSSQSSHFNLLRIFHW